MQATLDARLIDKITASGRLYEVGGSVRDSLISPDTANKDRDYLVTGISLERLMAILHNFGKVDLVGKSFGVIKFTPRGESEATDIAIPRREKSTGEGHRDFEVDFDPDLPVQVDLKRRDFTINAIAREIPSGEIIDPYGGRNDLGDKTIRMVFPEAMIEDPLRIMRGGTVCGTIRICYRTGNSGSDEGER